jgi:hypothetical protein
MGNEILPFHTMQDWANRCHADRKIQPLSPSETKALFVAALDSADVVSFDAFDTLATVHQRIVFSSAEELDALVAAMA